VRNARTIAASLGSGGAIRERPPLSRHSPAQGCADGLFSGAGEDGGGAIRGFLFPPDGCGPAGADDGDAIRELLCAGGPAGG